MLDVILTAAFLTAYRRRERDRIRQEEELERIRQEEQKWSEYWDAWEAWESRVDFQNDE